MGVHGLVSRIRGIAGVFAGIEQVGEGRDRLGGDAPGGQGRGDVILVLVGHIHRQFVGHEAHEGPMELLIEGRIEILAQEVPGQLQTLKGLAGGLAVAAAGHVGAAGRQLPQRQPHSGGTEEQQGHKNPVGGFAHEEALILGQGSLCLDEADVLAEVLYALTVHRQRAGAVRGGLRRTAGAPVHGQAQGIRLGRRIAAGLHVIVGETYRRQDEIARAARDERVFEGLGAVGAALVRG